MNWVFEFTRKIPGVHLLQEGTFLFSKTITVTTISHGKCRDSSFQSYLIVGASSRNRAWRRVLARSYIPKLLKVIEETLHKTLPHFYRTRLNSLQRIAN